MGELRLSEYKISGHCTLCDEPCFDIVQVQEAHERRPGEPKRIGPPLEGSMRITFLLFDGTRTDLTFCADCSAGLAPDSYIEIWRKNLRSWMRELSEKPEAERKPEWFMRQFSGGLLCEVGRQNWKDLTNA